MNDLYDRINLNIDLEEISKQVCKDYDLGDFIKNEIITVGYEDFNYILTTDKNKFCVKIFNKNRTEKDCNNYIDRIKLSSEINVNSPRIHKFNNDELLYKCNNDNIQYRLCVFEFIDGNSFFDLNQIPTEEEIKEIIRQMAVIHNSKLDSEFIYDMWTITNFKQEFEMKKKYLNEADLVTLTEIANRFDEIDFNKLAYSFVHGDIISTNVLKDKNNKLWIVDYAVSNYLPRIVDLAVSSCNLCLDPESQANTQNKIKLIINEYEKYNKLTEYERKTLPLFFDLANAMGMLQTCYQNGIGNYSEENDYWLNESRKGIEFSTESFWKSIL